MIWIGLAITIVSEGATLARVEPFYSWNTPICWTGFILFADSFVFARSGRSWIRSTPREFAWLALLSIPLWLVFEGYNRIIQNWYYVGLPENWWLRMLGYAWSFATIWPAIFEGADLVATWRDSPHARPVLPAVSASPALAARARPVVTGVPVLSGAAMLVAPFLVPPTIARYMAAPIWLGFIFLLDPINARMGGPSLARDSRLTVDLLLSGLLCGVLWEFWNYWSGAKWHYTVPIMQDVKLFEMPLPGYLGFPPFALECFTMFVFVRLMFRHRAG